MNERLSDKLGGESNVMDIANYVSALGANARAASRELASATTGQKNAALMAIADAIDNQAEGIKKANAIDIKNGQSNGLSDALLDRLKLDDKRIEQMSLGVRQVAALADPVGDIDGLTPLVSGIRLGKMRVPIGVIGIIYESRPNVTADAASICLKSGNACVLRGGKEAINSNMEIAAAIKIGLEKASMSPDCVQVLNRTEREAVTEMITAVEYFDVIIPRGGKGLISSIADNARVPVIKHLDGNCHIYIDAEADLDEARAVALNAKTRRYGVCNAMESLLVAESVAQSFLPAFANDLEPFSVELRGCAKTLEILPNIKEATEDDWYTEYLAPILSVKVVSDVENAISHINKYGSHHTDAIMTKNVTTADIFLREVDSSSVILNASTAFADGFEYGLGAEIGISTDKLHVRGPVGVEGLTTQKYVVLGQGETRSA